MLRDPDFGRGVFICSKPLQFLISASIVRQYAVTKPEIYVVTSTIADANDFLKFLRASSYSKLFSAIHACTDHPQAVDGIRELEYESLFIEDDRVSLYRLFKPIKTKYMAVLEEGFGTYRDDYRVRLSYLRRTKWILLSALTGCGLFFGHGRATDYVMVQYPAVYRALNPGTGEKALPIPQLANEFTHARRDWDRVVEESALRVPDGAANVALVLGTWGGAPSGAIRKIVESHDVVYYKPHPNDRSLVGAESLLVVGASWVPAEVYIDHLAANCTSLTVYHFVSTAYLNCLNRYDNVSFVELCENARFAEVSKQLHSHVQTADRSFVVV